MKKRFTKRQLIDELWKRFNLIQDDYRFDRNNGWAQVANASPEVNRAYGEWRAIESVINGIEGGYLGYGYGGAQ